jgi:hypothetical protein
MEDALCCACLCVPCSAQQRRVRTVRGASLRRSPLRADFPAVLGLVARRRTRFVHSVHCARTAAPSQLLMRAARAATSPVLLGASQARRGLPALAFVERLVVRNRNATLGGSGRGRRYPVGAISGATSSAGSGSARASALRQLTRRGCLSVVSAANEASSAARPWTEQRSAVAAERRPPQHKPSPGTACRDSLKVAKALNHQKQQSLPNRTCSS